MDNATYITSNVCTDFHNALGIHHQPKSVYHPQANVTGRLNRNLKPVLVAYTERHKDWGLKLAEMVFVTGMTVNRSTGTPHVLLTQGKELNSLQDSALTCITTSPRPYWKFAGDLRQRLTSAVQKVGQHLEVFRIKQAEH